MPLDSTRIQVGLLRAEGVAENRLETLALRCVKKLKTPGQYRPRYHSYLGGRAVLGELMQRAGLTGWIEAQSHFGYLQLLSPEGAPRSDAYVNVSHTDTCVGAALHHAPIGIDVERVTRDARKAAGRVVSGEEIGFLERPVSLPGGEVAGALALWCGKEAVSKALGLGVVFGMHQFEIDLSGKPPFAVDCRIQGPLPLKSPVVWIERRDDILVALCTQSDTFTRVDWQTIRF